MERPSSIRRALLDASALIGVIQGEPEFACLKPLLRAVGRGEITLVESTAILTEVLPSRPKETAARRMARATVLSLLDSPDTELVDVSIAVARKAADLRSKTGMHTWDAIHLATGILASVDVVIVRDQKFPHGDYEGTFVTGPFDLDDDKLPMGPL